MKILSIAVALLIYSNLCAQIGIGINSPNPSAILDITNTTNKGVLFPRVNMTNTDLKSTTSPIDTPTEGLIIYNNNENVQIKGYYIFRNGAWNLISTDRNKTTDLLMYVNKTSDINTINGINDIYKDINIAKFKQDLLINTSLITYDPNNDKLILPKGNYLVTLTINALTDETISSGINNTKIHTHSYKFRAKNSVTGVKEVNSTETVINVSSNADIKKHTIIARISLSIPSETEISLQLSRISGNSTYLGDIRYTDASLHILNAIKK